MVVWLFCGDNKVSLTYKKYTRFDICVIPAKLRHLFSTASNHI